MSDMVPPIALRTYTAIRMGVVAVIVALGIAVWREIVHSPEHCVQRSLSAYYYTPVRPIFVGALLILGFVMIVMWGMTAWEDAALNLAGLLLLVVALVPTLDANYCSIPRSIRGKVPSTETNKIADDALIRANADQVGRSFTALMAVVILTLLFVAVAGVVAYRRSQSERRPTQRAIVAYAITWVLTAVAVVIYLILYRNHADPDSAFNHRVHSTSANLAVAFVILAVVLAAIEKARSPGPHRTRWVWFYGLVAAAMVLAAVVIKGGDRIGIYSGWMDAHATFVVEAVLIALIGIFWSLQTIDRRHRGAPTY